MPTPRSRAPSGRVPLVPTNRTPGSTHSRAGAVKAVPPFIKKFRSQRPAERGRVPLVQPNCASASMRLSNGFPHLPTGRPAGMNPAATGNSDA